MVTGGLATALDELFDLDPTALSDDELHDAVIDLGRQNQLRAAWCQLVRTWDTRQLMGRRRLESTRRPPVTCVPDAQGPPPTTSSTKPAPLQSMPNTATAFAQGEITGDHVDLLASANTASRAGAKFAHRRGDAGRNSARRRGTPTPCASSTTGSSASTPRPATTATKPNVCVTAATARSAPGGAAKVDLDGRVRPDRLARSSRKSCTACCEAAAPRRTNATAPCAPLQQRRARRPRRDGDAVGHHPHRRAATPAAVDDTRSAIEPFGQLCQLAARHRHHPRPRPAATPRRSRHRTDHLRPAQPPEIEASHRRNFTGAVRRIIEARDQHCQHNSGCDTQASRCDIDHIHPPQQRRHRPASATAASSAPPTTASPNSRNPPRRDRGGLGAQAP